MAPAPDEVVVPVTTTDLLIAGVAKDVRAGLQELIAVRQLLEQAIAHFTFNQATNVTQGAERVKEVVRTAKGR